MKKKILIVEDVTEHALLLKSVLQDFDLKVATSIKEAKQNLEAGSYDLIVLDLNLEDGSGFEVLTYKNLIKGAGVLICSDKSELANKVASFNLGAFDFVPKPFDPIELRLRVQSFFTRSSPQSLISVEGILIDTDKLLVTFNQEGEECRVDLTFLEFRILKYLAENKGQVVTRNQILDFIWGQDHFSTDRVVDSHISKIRRKLGTKGEVLQSIYGGGYSLKPSMQKAA